MLVPGDVSLFDIDQLTKIVFRQVVRVDCKNYLARGLLRLLVENGTC